MYVIEIVMQDNTDTAKFVHILTYVIHIIYIEGSLSSRHNNTRVLRRILVFTVMEHFWVHA